MSRNGKPSLLISPNSVLANALLRSIDILRPRILATRPSRIEFVVGTQINGAPHLGTNLVQTAAFLLAKIARREFSIDTRVRFGALDNAPHEVVLDPETHTAYQQTYYHALGKDKISELIDGYYQAFFISLSQATDTGYEVETYTDQQATPRRRRRHLHRGLLRSRTLRGAHRPRRRPALPGWLVFFVGSRGGGCCCARLIAVDHRVWEGSGDGAGADADTAGVVVVHRGVL